MGSYTCTKGWTPGSKRVAATVLDPRIYHVRVVKADRDYVVNHYERERCPPRDGPPAEQERRVGWWRWTSLYVLSHHGNDHIAIPV